MTRASVYVFAFLIVGTLVPQLPYLATSAAAWEPECALIPCPDGTIAACQPCRPGNKVCPDGTVVAPAIECPKTPEGQCTRDMGKAQAKLLKAIRGAATKAYLDGGVAAAQGVVDKATQKLADDYATAQAKAQAAGRSCPTQSDVAATVQAAVESVMIKRSLASGILRFKNLGDGTVLDEVTGLQWEMKDGPSDSIPNLANPHDADNRFTWGSIVAPYAPNGTIFTDFLAKLNDGACLGGTCDWRLPTADELRGLLLARFPDCTVFPCIEQSLTPIASGPYWSSTSVANAPGTANAVEFEYGISNVGSKSEAFRARAVRNGRTRQVCPDPTVCPNGEVLFCQTCPTTKECPDGAVIITPPGGECPESPEVLCSKAIAKAEAKLQRALYQAAFDYYESGQFTKAQEKIAAATQKFADAAQKIQDLAVKYGADCVDDSALDLIAAEAAESVDLTITDVAGTRWADNGDGTILDSRTGLQWEMKEGPVDAVMTPANPHDVDNLYTWSVGGAPYPADGTVFSDFLPRLNGFGGPCLAGTCDWRMPAAGELEDLRLAPFPCSTSPCIDVSFSPVGVDSYWSATSSGSTATFVDFTDGESSAASKYDSLLVRAVRNAESDHTPPAVTTTCGVSSKCIFATSTFSTGNLGGLVGADATCNALAGTAGLPGTYVAWLSTNSIDAITRVTSNGPYMSPTGDLVASSLVDLTDGSLNTAIAEDENGTTLPILEIWTGSDAAGVKRGSYCANWTEGTMGLGDAGRTTFTTSAWSYSFAQFCDREISLYCIQQ